MPYLPEMRQSILSLAGHCYLRSAVCGQLTVPRYRLTPAGRRVFSFTGPSAWNGLSTYLKDDSRNLDSFNVFLNHFFLICIDSAFSKLEISRNDSALYKCSLIIIIN